MVHANEEPQSTGGLTNKKAGRIGDTPTAGSGFWAESWDETTNTQRTYRPPFNIVGRMPVLDEILTQTSSLLGSCLSSTESDTEPRQEIPPPTYSAYKSPPLPSLQLASTHRPSRHRRHALAMSGTGNGDSFVRVNACRTVASICRLDVSSPPLVDAMRAIAGPKGELQRSAGDRWGKTGEGQGGMIGIEVIDEADSELQNPGDRKEHMTSKRKRGHVAFAFNCGGLFRAYYEIDEQTGREKPTIMVFKDQY